MPRIEISFVSRAPLAGFPDAHGSAQKQDKHTTSDNRDQLTMSNLDERLERIEKQVMILLERQRLSRFDNIMFLIYPLVIFGTTLSFTISLQYDVIRNIQMWGVPLLPILETLRLIFVGVFGVAFSIFVIGYARDSMKGRLMSLYMLGVVGFLWTLPVLLPLLSLLRIVLPDIFTSWEVQFLLWMSCGGAIFYLVSEELDRLLGRLAKWFQDSVPITLKESRAYLDSWRTPDKHRLWIKVLWSTGLVVYFAALGIAAWEGQLSGRSVYDSLYIAAFLIATEAIMIWRL
jgi:hypothetical protein